MYKHMYKNWFLVFKDRNFTAVLMEANENFYISM